MVTDDDRREVARRLRGLEVCEFDGEFIDCGEVENVLGLVSDDGAWYEAEGVTRLADLIEPDSTIPTDSGEAALASVEGLVREMRHSTEEEQNEYSAMLKKMSVELYPVDRDALLLLADDMESFGGENDRTLRRMGVVVDSWASCARRIRDALGVEDA